ncbi:acyl carrier protein [Kitasatospora sp. NPDC005856]|uniref:acyl carrier protein n=1 Tax=Kitasatospora sp. NPDC005856 TaxID=3154566 RepID=UPI0033F3E55A
MSDIRDSIHAYILANIIKDTDPSALPDDLELVESGVLDSIGIMKLVTFLETTFDIEVGVSHPREYFKTVNHIVEYVEVRVGGAGNEG